MRIVSVQRFLRCAGIALLAVAVPTGAATQSRPESAQFDTTAVGLGSHSRACVVLEGTLFRVDVLTLEVRFGPDTADRIRRLVRAGAGRDSVAAAAIESRDAFARTEYLRDVPLDRFLEAARDNLRVAVEAGVITRAAFQEISGGLPRWYRFLEGRGVRAGDRLLYRIRGDTLHAGYRTAADSLRQQTDIGAERRRAVLGSYFAPGSPFRDRLLAALLTGDPGC